MNDTLMVGQSSIGFSLSPEQQAFARNSEAQLRGFSIDIYGALDKHRLQQALISLLERQPLLKSSFKAVKGYRGLRRFADSDQSGIILTHRQAGSSSEFESWCKNALQELTQDFDNLGVDSVPIKVSIISLRQQRASLFVVCSALLLDEGSIKLFFTELASLYQGDLKEDKERSTYEQYVDWRHELSDDEDAVAGIAYWQRYVGPQVVEEAAFGAVLPCRLQAHGRGGRALSLMIKDGSSIKAIQQIALTLQQPTSVIAQAAWWLLLQRLSGQERLLVGWCHDCRQDYEYFATTIAPFEKVLPLSLEFSSGESFIHWSQKLTSVLDEHRGWQEFWSIDNPEVSVNKGYGFHALEMPGPVVFSDSRWSLGQIERFGEGFDLELQFFYDAEGQASGYLLNYLADSYSAQAINILLDQYQTLLLGLAESLDSPIGDISLLSEQQRQAVLELNPRRTELSSALLPAVIDRWMAETPGATALVDGQRRLTYADLQQQVQLTSHGLHAQQVKKGDLIALDIPRSAEFVVALLAVWSIGAAYLPLDVEWPSQRRQKIIDAALPVLIIGENASDQFCTSGHKYVTLTELQCEIVQGSSEFEAVSLKASDIAYVLFTSGSTGAPKGVVIEHGNVLNYAVAATAAMGLSHVRRFALSSTVAADLGNTTLLPALLTGATLYIASDEVMRSEQAFKKFLTESAIDCLKIVPSHLAALMDEDTNYLPRVLILGGEPASSALIERLLSVSPDCNIYNHYGPTEATVGVMIHKVGCEVTNVLPLTQVMANSRVYVLDSSTHLAPIGQLGTLYIGGEQVCRGYLNDPKSQVFIDDPFVPGERLYATGDIAWYKPEGGIQINGRSDHQIKIRGFRIEPAEIEAVILGYPRVFSAVVVPWAPDGTNHKRLVAYVHISEPSVADQPSEDVQTIQDYLAERLPSVMQPAHVFILKSLPRLPNGKVDRRSLPQPEKLLTTVEYVAPRTALETLLERAMSELLSLPRLSVNEDFFAAGGHSLLVIRLVARIRKLLHVEVPPATVFDHPSVAGLAVALQASELEKGKLEKVASMRQQLDAMTPEQRQALMEKARSRNPS